MRLIKHIQNFQAGGITESELETSKYILNKLISSGISPKVSSAITGNLIRESRLNPQALSETGKYFGIAQWGDSRRKELMSFAKSQKKAPSDLDLQIDFIVKELKGSHKKVWEKAEKAKDVVSSANIISGEYEVAGHKESYPERAEYAKKIFNLNTPKNFKLKSEKVNIDDIHNNLTYYLNTLPENLKEKVLITSGNDQGHSKKSRHYNNKAIDLRLTPELFDYMKTDPNRLKYGITLLDPNHGTAPHIHLSYGEGTENKKDVWKDPFSKNRDWEILDLSNQDVDIQPQNNLTTSPYNIERQDLSNQAYLSAIEGRLNTATEELAKFQEEREQEQKKQETLQQEDAQRQVLQQAQQQKEEIYNLLTANPPESLQYDVSSTQQAFSQIQPFQFQSDFYSGEGLFQEGGDLEFDERVYELDTATLSPNDFDSPKKFLQDYINSPNYKERLINSGYSNVDELVQNRLNDVQGVKLTKIQEQQPGLLRQLYNEITGEPYTTTGSVYRKDDNSVILDKQQAEFLQVPLTDVWTHEIGHSELSSISLNDFDRNEIEKRLIINKNDNLHASDPEEIKADLNTIRYQLFKKNITDPKTKQINKEDMEKLDSSFIKDRLTDSVGEENLIWLLNNIAQNTTQQPITYTKSGGHISPLAKIKQNCTT